MNVAILLVLYASVLTWFGPPLLRRVSGPAAHPRLVVATWVTAVAAVIAAWGGALCVLLIEVSASIWRHSSLTICMKVLGVAGRMGLPRAVGSAVALGFLTAGLAVTAVVIRRVVHQLRRQWACSRRHASIALMIGRASGRSGVVVIPAKEPAAYCVAGRPNVIVVTSAALERLGESELSAVLAHERAHLSGRHHILHLLLRAIAASIPRLPLFPAAATRVAELLEMCADDVAVRRHGPGPLLNGLLSLTEQPPLASSTALGAVGTAVLARAARLASPASRAVQWRQRLVLTTAMWLAILLPLAAGLACQL